MLAGLEVVVGFVPEIEGGKLGGIPTFRGYAAAEATRVRSKHLHEIYSKG